MKAFKGFNKNLVCRGYQYELGKSYETPEKPECCNNGFHACENPIDVFNYYNPADSRYCEVEMDGDLDREEDGGDSKVASSKITIGVEIGLKGIIEGAVKFILEKVNWKDAKESNTGDQSAATNTGYQSAATNTGYQSAATNTGDQSAATNTGYQSAATNTGDQSAANVEGAESVAASLGIKGKAKGALGCWLVIAEWIRDENYGRRRKDVKCVKVDGETTKADTWYQLVDGEFIEYTEEEG